MIHALPNRKKRDFQTFYIRPRFGTVGLGHKAGCVEVNYYNPTFEVTKAS